MEVERKEFEWTDIKVIIEKRRKEPPAMKSKQTAKMKNAQVHAAPKTKHKGTATCNIGVTAMNQECQTQLTGIDVTTQTPEHGIEEEIKRENQKRILAQQLKEAEKKIAEKKAAEKKALDEAEKLEMEKEERILQESKNLRENANQPTDANKKSKNKKKKKKKKCKDFRDRIVSLDCEVAGVGKKGRFSVLARACVVSGHGEVLIDQYCSSERKVTDYRTWISGIEEKHMKNAQPYYKLKQKVNNAIAGKIVVGHGLSHDFQALRINHSKSMQRDSAEYFRGKFTKKKRPGLKELAKDQLGREIQAGAHSPVIDAKAALDIYLKNREEWEAKAALTEENKENIPKKKAMVEKNKTLKTTSSPSISLPSEYDESDIDDDWISFMMGSDSDITTDSEDYEASQVYFPGLGYANRADYDSIIGSGLVCNFMHM